MTDNEIIKALECCSEDSDCKHCPYYVNERYKCGEFFNKDVLDLINRQKAEIERLEKVQVQYVKAYFDEFAERLKNDFRLAQLDIGLTSAVIDELVETMKNEFSTLADFTDLIKAEAVKEFAERLKDYYIKDKRYDRPYAHTMISILFGLIDDLVEEMAGDAE